MLNFIVIIFYLVFSISCKNSLAKQASYKLTRSIISDGSSIKKCDSFSEFDILKNNGDIGKIIACGFSRMSNAYISQSSINIIAMYLNKGVWKFLNRIFDEKNLYKNKFYKVNYLANQSSIHNKPIISFINIGNNILASCCGDKIVKVFHIDFLNFSIKSSLVANIKHDKNVYSICSISINSFAVGLLDGYTKIYKLNKNVNNGNLYNVSLLHTLDFVQPTMLKTNDDLFFNSISKILTLNSDKLLLTGNSNRVVSLWKYHSKFKKFTNIYNDYGFSDKKFLFNGIFVTIQHIGDGYIIFLSKEGIIELWKINSVNNVDTLTPQNISFTRKCSSKNLNKQFITLSKINTKNILIAGGEQTKLTI